MAEIPASPRSPNGFLPLPRSSPYLDHIGPLFYKPEGKGVVIALRIEAHHTNTKGTAHGGVLLALADLTLGRNTEYQHSSGTSLWTVSLSADFVGTASVGDWVEGRAEFLKSGRSLSFANCYLSVNDERILRASAVLKAPGKGLSAPPSGLLPASR